MSAPRAAKRARTGADGAGADSLTPPGGGPAPARDSEEGLSVDLIDMLRMGGLRCKCGGRLSARPKKAACKSTPLGSCPESAACPEWVYVKTGVNPTLGARRGAAVAEAQAAAEAAAAAEAEAEGGEEDDDEDQEVVIDDALLAQVRPPHGDSRQPAPASPAPPRPERRAHPHSCSA